MQPKFYAILEINKVIRPKSRALALSKRQADRQTNNFFFKKTFETAIYFTKFPFLPFRDTKTLFKALKTVLLLTVGPTDRKVAYGVV